MKIYVKIAILLAMFIPGTNCGASPNTLIVHPSNQVTDSEQVSTRFIKAYHQLLTNAQPGAQRGESPVWQTRDEAAVLSLVDWDMVKRFKKNITHDKFFQRMYPDYPGVADQNPLEVVKPEISAAGTFYLKDMRNSMCVKAFNKVKTVRTSSESLDRITKGMSQQIRSLPEYCLDSEGAEIAIVVYVATLAEELDYFTVMLNPKSNQVVDMDGFQ